MLISEKGRSCQQQLGLFKQQTGLKPVQGSGSYSSAVHPQFVIIPLALPMSGLGGCVISGYMNVPMMI